MNEALAITQTLGGRWHGSYGMCCCPAHDDRNPSMKVFNNRVGELRFNCFAGCDWRDIKDELRRSGILQDRIASPETIDHRQERERIQRAADDMAACLQKQKQQIALRLWNEAQSATETLVPGYLQTRGIYKPIPPSIRGYDSLYHTPTGQHFPAMIAAVTTWSGREVVGVHRTFLNRDGQSKAAITPNKMMYGICSGGSVQLAPAGEELVITEGIETGLSVMQSLGIPTWAALSTGGIRSLKLPPTDLTKHIIICADNDAAGISAANAAAEAWRLEGYSVKVAIPPISGTDFNDLLKGDLA